MVRLDFLSVLSLALAATRYSKYSLWTTSDFNREISTNRTHRVGGGFNPPLYRETILEKTVN